MGKIFGIGLSRTGTKSLTAALARLGYKAGHYDVSVRAVRLGDREPVLDHDLIRDWDALTDIPIAAVYRTLDRDFPGAKFVLTVRDERSWLASCERHYSADRSAYVRKHGIDPSRILDLRRRVYGQEVFAPERFRSVYEQHVAGALSHFRGRSQDLLVLDVCGGAGWPELCGFLGRPVPPEPFPRENVWRGGG